MSVLVLDHSVKTIDSNGIEHDLSNLVTEISRKACICETIATGSVAFTDIPVHITINPYDLVVIEEMGDLVFTGYVTNYRIETNPWNHTIEFADKAILLKDYFLTEPKDSNGETARTWISVFCSLAGVTHQFDTQLPITIPPPEPGTHTWEMGTSALNIIEELLIYNGYWMYSTPNGVIHFSQGHYVPIFNTLGSGINILESLRNRSIIPARNRVVVFGIGGVSAEESYDVPELTGTTITAIVASPYIKSQSGVNTLADRLALAFARVKDEKQLKIIGDTDITLAQFVNIKDGWLGIDANGQITGVKSHMGNDGYFMDVTIDQYCPKIWGSYGWDEDDEGLPFTEALSAYSSTAGHFWHAAPEGSVFVERNSGLTGADIADFCGRYDPFWSVKKSSIDPEKVILLKGDLGHIYKSSDAGITWSDCTPTTDPPNTWEDTTPPTAGTVNYIRVASSNITSGLHFVLATYQGDSSRWCGWVLMTTDDGINWTWSDSTGWLYPDNIVINGDFQTAPDGAPPPGWSAPYRGFYQSQETIMGSVSGVATNRCLALTSSTYGKQTLVNAAGTYTVEIDFDAIGHESNCFVRIGTAGSWNAYLDKTSPRWGYGTLGYGANVWTGISIGTNAVLSIGGAFTNVGDLGGHFDNFKIYDGYTDAFPIWTDVDSDNLWVTLYGGGHLYLEKRSLTDMSLITLYDLGVCTLAQVLNKTYIAYVFAAANTVLDSNDVYLFGKMSSIPSLTGEQTVARSIDAGTTWTSIKTTPTFTAFADLGGEYIGVGNDKYFYKGTGVLLPVGYPGVGVPPGSLTVSATGAVAVGSDSGSVVKESFNNGVTWSDISAGITGSGSINSLTYV